MYHADAASKTYADNGYRSAADWRTFGREVPEGARPRIEADGKQVRAPLFTRDQTRALVRPARTPRAPAPAPAPVPAPGA